MKIASFDIEIASVIPANVSNWAEQPDLGISCAAVAFSDSDDVRFWSNEERLRRSEAQALVEDLTKIQAAGYSIVTWNGCSFDFRVLAAESGMLETASRLAMDHIDLMLMVTFSKGWFLSLEKALIGAGLPGKLKAVELADGSVVHDMDGSKAPKLWARGEYDAVLAYLEQDVVQQLKLAELIRERRQLRWTSNAGRPQSVRFPKLLTVKECFSIPEPDTSWMTDPPTRSQFTSWMA